MSKFDKLLAYQTNEVSRNLLRIWTEKIYHPHYFFPISYSLVCTSQCQRKQCHSILCTKQLLLPLRVYHHYQISQINTTLTNHIIQAKINGISNVLQFWLIKANAFPHSGHFKNDMSNTMTDCRINQVASDKKRGSGTAPLIEILRFQEFDNISGW